MVYNDLLIWSFIQQKDWQGALLQSKAVDKRLNEEGRKIIELGWICQSNEVYDIAIQCFEYVKLLGADKRYFYQAQQGVLQNGLLQIKASNGADIVNLRLLEKEYISFLNYKPINIVLFYVLNYNNSFCIIIIVLKKTFHYIFLIIYLYTLIK